ncbi:hypothetical protein J4H89_23655 (plasmid) [Ralstonia solanacearum]|nr:hypothetical protein J4H89_23655 [Ralstonia solanacearum]
MKRDTADKSAQELASKLLVDSFARTGPVATAPSDPVADTQMVVTLDELQPYELNPRVRCNPLYEDIKASIRQRGLDAPPAITRRPGAAHYIIRNGGNTRLDILKALWAETHDERFFRIPCLFRPWSPRGEIVALTGHLAESELHGQLTFIERAIAVERAREFYEQESPATLSQSELARRLTQDGYPITQPHISRMQDAVYHLLPAIPKLLYGGLGKPQIERLAALRRAAAQAWGQHTSSSDDFPDLFQEVLTLFDIEGSELHLQRVQDELIGQMAERLSVSYDKLCLDVEEAQTRQRVLTREPSRVSVDRPADTSPAPASNSKPSARKTDVQDTTLSAGAATADTPKRVAPADHPKTDAEQAIPPTISPVPNTERLQSVRQLVAEHTEGTKTDTVTSGVQTVPIEAGGLYPITDVWQVAAALDDPIPLRTHIAQLAREIAAEAGMEDRVASVGTGIGYVVEDGAAETMTEPSFSRAIRGLLRALSRTEDTPATAMPQALAEDLAPLLLGTTGTNSVRLSDPAVVKLYRLIRLARCLYDHARRHTGASDEPVHGGP